MFSTSKAVLFVAESGEAEFFRRFPGSRHEEFCFR